MPDRKTHVVIGTAVGGACALIVSEGQKEGDRFLEFIGGCLGGYLGGRSADYFEPATHPGHRQFVHSAAAGGISAASANLMATGWVQIFRELAEDVAGNRRRPNASDLEKNLGAIFEILLRIAAGVGPGIIAGYISHLALDATTKKSLPLL